MKLQEIAINDIRITENHRTNIEKTDLEELMQSIKQRGLMQPIGLAVEPGKKGYILRFGQRRYLACKKLGWKKITATIVEASGKEDLLVDNLSENMQRKNPNFAELGRMIKQLEDLNLNLKQIAVKLGLPLIKIKQIVSVYNLLPEKYRSKVMFMEKGAGRSDANGSIPANVAVKVVRMRKEHGLKEKDVDTILKSVVEDKMGTLDLNNVGVLVESGMSAEQALENAREYGVFTVDVCIKYEDLQKIMDEYSILSRQHVFKKVIYGELPALVKPSFVSTGLKSAKKVIVKFDPKPYNAMFKQLLKLSKAHGLSEEQAAAVKSINDTAHYTWTKEQCDQIKSIYDIKFTKAGTARSL